jgi:hypothetical protein
MSVTKVVLIHLWYKMLAWSHIMDWPPDVSLPRLCCFSGHCTDHLACHVYFTSSFKCK